MENEKIETEEKSCGNCINCYKYEVDGKETWACEEYGFFYLGVPANVTPPNDKACELWTNDTEKKNIWEKFV